MMNLIILQNLRLCNKWNTIHVSYSVFWFFLGPSSGRDTKSSTSISPTCPCRVHEPHWRRCPLSKVVSLQSSSPSHVRDTVSSPNSQALHAIFQKRVKGACSRRSDLTTRLLSRKITSSVHRSVEVNRKPCTFFHLK